MMGDEASDCADASDLEQTTFRGAHFVHNVVVVRALGVVCQNARPNSGCGSLLKLSRTGKGASWEQANLRVRANLFKRACVYGHAGV